MGSVADKLLSSMIPKGQEVVAKLGHREEVGLKVIVTFAWQIQPNKEPHGEGSQVTTPESPLSSQPHCSSLPELPTVQSQRGVTVSSDVVGGKRETKGKWVRRGKWKRANKELNWMFPTSGPRESPQSSYRFTRVKRKLCFFMVTVNMSAFSPKARSWMSEQWIGFHSLHHIRCFCFLIICSVFSVALGHTRIQMGTQERQSDEWGHFRRRRESVGATCPIRHHVSCSQSLERDLSNCSWQKMN